MLDLQIFGVPGCNLYVTPDALFFLPATAGTMNWPLPLPLVREWAGIQFFMQGLVADSGATGNITVTNAAQGRTGLR